MAAHPANRSASQSRAAAAVQERTGSRNSYLHSSGDVLGYHIQARDGEIGHVDDLIVDDRSWAIRFLRVDTSNWIGGKAVVVPQQSLQSVDWPMRRIHVKVTREEVRNSPEYDPSLLDGDTAEQYEGRLADYYRIAR